MIESVQSNRSTISSFKPSEPRAGFGTVSYPSENIEKLIKNEFNSRYIKSKVSHDDTVDFLKHYTEKHVSLRNELKDSRAVSSVN